MKRHPAGNRTRNAMASAMPVVEPTGNGLGADCFVILWHEGKMYGLNASGPAPKSLSVAALKDRGFEKIPSYGVCMRVACVAHAVAGINHVTFGRIGIILRIKFNHVLFPNLEIGIR